jgi:hypothetical protein
MRWLFMGGYMGQLQAKSNTSTASAVFVPLHINDLVKGRLLWQEQIGKRSYPSEALPNVIHPDLARLVTVR